MYCTMMCLNGQNYKNSRKRQRTSLTSDPRKPNVCLYKMLLKEKKQFFVINLGNFIILWMDRRFSLDFYSQFLNMLRDFVKGTLIYRHLR